MPQQPPDDPKARLLERIRSQQQQQPTQPAEQPTRRRHVRRTEPRSLPAPPSEGGGGVTLGDIGKWVSSKEGGGAFLTRLGFDIGGSLAGAGVGARVGSLAGPWGALAGGLTGAAVGGFAGGYGGEYAGQKLEGRDTSSPEATRERRLAGAVGAIPFGLGRAKTPARMAIKAAREGAGAAAGYEAGRQTYVEGRPVSEIELAPVAKAGAGGAIIGGVMGRLSGRRHQRRPAADQPRRGGAISRSLPPPPEPADPRLTAEAARQTTRKGGGQGLSRRQRIQAALDADQQLAPPTDAPPVEAPAAAPNRRVEAAVESLEAVTQPFTRKVDPAKAAAAELRKNQAELKKGMQSFQSRLRQQMGPDTPGGEKELQIAALTQKVRRIIAGKATPEEYNATRMELAGHGMGGALDDITKNVTKMSDEALALAQSATPRKGGRQATPKAPRIQYSNTRNGRRAAHAKAAKLNEQYPGSDAKVVDMAKRRPDGTLELPTDSRGNHYRYEVQSRQRRNQLAATKGRATRAINAKKKGTAAPGKPARATARKPAAAPVDDGIVDMEAIRRTGSQITGKEPDLPPKLLQAGPQELDDFISLGQGALREAKGAEAAEIRRLLAAARRLRAQKGQPAAAAAAPTARARRTAGEEPPPITDEDLIDGEDIIMNPWQAQVNEEVDAILAEQAAKQGAAADIPKKLPPGSVPDDWQPVPVGTKELTEDLAQRLKADGIDVWIRPGGPRRKYTLYTQKDAVLPEYAQEYGIRPGGGRPSPEEVMPAPGRAGSLRPRPDRPAAVPPPEGATIADRMSAKGQSLPAPPVEPPTARPYTGAPLTAEQRQANLIGPTAGEQRTLESALDRMPDELPTPAHRARAEKLTDAQLRNAVEKAQDPRVRRAALDELDQRGGGAVARDDQIEDMARRNLRQGEYIVPTDPLQRQALLRRLQDMLPTAPTNRMARIRQHIKKILESEAGGLRFWKQGDDVATLGDPRLDKLRVEAQESLLKRGVPDHHGQTFFERMMKRWYDKDWNLRVAVHEAIARGQVWDAETNPLIQRQLAQGRMMGRVEEAYSMARDAFARVHDASLSNDFTDFMNLSINVRAEKTAIQHLLNARQAVEEAQAALMAAQGRGLTKRKLRPYHRKVRFARQQLSSAEKEWAGVEKGRGLLGGFKPGESEARLRELQEKMTPENWQVLQEAGDTHARLHDAALEESIESGMISREMAEQYRARGPYHAPILRLAKEAMGNLDQKVQGYRQHGLIGERESKLLLKFTGDTRSSENPQIASMLHLAQIHRQNWENAGAVRVVDGMRQIPEYAGVIKKLSHEGAKVDGPELAKIPLWRNGRKEWWQVPYLLGETIAQPGRLQLEIMGIGPLRALQVAKNVMTRSSTVWRPSFLFARNIRRDMGAARFSLPEAYSYGNPNDYVRHAKEHIQAVKDIMTHTAGADETPYIREFMRSGAPMSTLQRSMTPEVFIGQRQMDQIRRIGLESQQMTTKERARELLSETTDVLARGGANLASSLEMATKLVSYRRLREAGFSEDGAAYLTRAFGGSPDFSVGGELKPIADMLFMFFNPALRGIEQTVLAAQRFRGKGLMPPPSGIPELGEAQTLLNRIIKSKGPGFATRAMGTLAAAALLEVQWNHQPWFQDENGEYYIERYSDWERNNNLIIQIPGLWEETESGPRPYALKLAKPHHQVLLQSPLVKGLTRALFGEESAFTDPVKGIFDVVESASPVGISFGGGGSIAGDVASGLSSSANPIVGGAVDLARNVRSFTGGPIVGRSEEGVWAEEQHNPLFGLKMATEGTKKVNQVLRERLGWDLGIPPAKVDYFLQRAAPGLHQAGVALENMFGTLRGEQPIGGADPGALAAFQRAVPIIGDVVRATMGPGAAPDARLLELRDKFYRYTERAEKRSATGMLQYERALGKEDVEGQEAARQMLRSAPPLESDMARKAFVRIRDQLAKIHAKRGQLQMKMSQTHDQEERAAITREIQQLHNRELAGLRRWWERVQEIENE